MADQKMPEPWACPWGICNHEKAQACRADTSKGRHGANGCGGRFPPGTTSAQAKQMSGSAPPQQSPAATPERKEGGNP